MINTLIRYEQVLPGDVRVILTVTLNPAVDVTYLVDRLVPRSATRVASARQRAGGKGVNKPIAGESRQTLTIVETGRGSAGRGGAAGHPTDLREIGPEVTLGEWSRFLDRFARLAAVARVVVLSGSLPPGVPDGAYATLTGIARRAGTPVIVDTGGAALAVTPAGRWRASHDRRVRKLGGRRT